MSFTLHHRLLRFKECFSSRAAVVVRGGGVHKAALQEPSGGHGAQRLPVSEEAGGAAHQAHRRDPGHAAGDAGGHDHRWVMSSHLWSWSCRAWWLMEGLSSNPAWKEGFLFSVPS